MQAIDIQEEAINMSINVPYIRGIGEEDKYDPPFLLKPLCVKYFVNLKME